MSSIHAIIDVSNTYKNTHPDLNLNWVGQGRDGQGIMINGGKVHEILVTGDGQLIDSKHLKENYWQKRDTTKGVTRYMGVTVIFDSVADANKAWSDMNAGIFELADGVLLHFCGITTQRATHYRDIKSL